MRRSAAEAEMIFYCARFHDIGYEAERRRGLRARRCNRYPPIYRRHAIIKRGKSYASPLTLSGSVSIRVRGTLRMPTRASRLGAATDYHFLAARRYWRKMDDDVITFTYRNHQCAGN